MYREFVTLSKCHVLYFSPAQEKLLRGLVVSHAQLNVHCHLTVWPAWPHGWVAIQRATRRCPVSATGLNSCLQSWIFHLSISQDRCCFCLPRWRPCSNISFHHSSSPHIFFNLFPLCLPSWNHIPGCHCSVLLHFLFLSQSAHLCANPSHNCNGAWLKLV